uniref:hypothetical protein n=1 Tax=Alistipes sp. TaxID=1872444 RepID=UPI004056C4BC
MRSFPAFIIDRSRRSAASRFSDDFVVCTDREVGFIARVFTLPRSRREEFFGQLEALPPEEASRRFLVAPIGGGEAVAVLEVMKMLHEPVAHWSRLRPLMKKAMKAYLHGEVREVSGDGSPYDEQIGAISDLLRTMEAQRLRMEDANGKAATDRLV